MITLGARTNFESTSNNMQKVQCLQPTGSVYVALARPAKRRLGKVAATSLISRWVMATSRSRQNIAPSMKQFRLQSSYKNTTTAYEKKKNFVSFGPFFSFFFLDKAE